MRNDPRSKSIFFGTTKSVRFPLILEVAIAYIPKATPDEIGAKWFSDQDTESFQRTMLRDAIECSQAMTERSSKPQDGGEATKELMIRGIGLDHLISRNVPRRLRAVKDARKQHTTRIVQGQHGCHPRGLAIVSEMSSFAARERGRKVAEVSASLFDG